MNDAVNLKVELPKIADIELVALEGLERLARHLGIAEENIGEAKIIVTEAIINAFEHSGNPSSPVQVEFTMTQEAIVIFVRDYGKGFDSGSVPDPLLEQKLKAERKRGWGLKLMKELSDDFQIDSNTDGTKITIRKMLK